MNRKQQEEINKATALHMHNVEQKAREQKIIARIAIFLATVALLFCAMLTIPDWIQQRDNALQETAMKQGAEQGILLLTQTILERGPQEITLTTVNRTIICGEKTW